MKGYKVFNPDWTCRDFKYAVGQTYEMEGEPICCDRGFHFCTDLKDCFDYYKFDPNNKVAVVEALGAIDTEGDKSCTNKITIVEEITWEEVLHLVNTGKGCSGLCNSGNRNSGDWNKTSFSSGVFNTNEAKILMFNKPSDWTFRDWLDSKARYLLNQIKHDLLEWVWSENMTDAEKEQHPEHTTTGGYLKVLDESECGQKWWDSLSYDDKMVIASLPNFDVKIFEEITGIKTGEH